MPDVRSGIIDGGPVLNNKDYPSRSSHLYNKQEASGWIVLC